MKKLLSVFGILLMGAMGVVECDAQGVNTEGYVTNRIVSVSATTPTLLSGQSASRNSMAILFATNSTAGVGIRFFTARTDFAIATQTNQFKAGTIYGTYINPAGLWGSITVPVGWSWDATAVPATAVYGIADGAGAVVNVRVATPTKP